MGNYLVAVVLLVCLIALRAEAAVPGVTDLPAVDQLPVIQELPDPFLFSDGSRVRTQEDWSRRREELKRQILYYEFGHWPPASAVKATEVSSAASDATGATEKNLLLAVGPEGKVQYRLILTIPQGKSGRLPVIVKGDMGWGRVLPEILKMAAARGYAVAEFDRTEIAPDKNDRTTGVFPLYPEYDWSSEAAWAWGFSRTVDYLLTQDFVDPKHIVATGHSRGGKAALLAGAFDERFALVVPNGSGAGGAAVYRVMHPKGESLQAIATRFPFWFCPRFQGFIGKETRLPFDQHSLWALVAPRAILATEARGDLWANPSGCQQSYLAAKEAYRFFGAEDRVGIHYRDGKHEHGAEDWAALLDFADKQFFGKTVGRRFDQVMFPDEPKAFSWSAPAAAK